jgi:hypothetical protein
LSYPDVKSLRLVVWVEVFENNPAFHIIKTKMEEYFFFDTT